MFCQLCTSLKTRGINIRGTLTHTHTYCVIMKKRKKTLRNLHVEEIEYLDEDEQESLIDRYKIKEKKNRSFWIQMYQLVTLLLMFFAAFSAIATDRFCILINILSSEAIVSETNCLFAFCSTFICFCCCMVGLADSSSIEGETNYYFIFGIILPSLLFGMSYGTKHIFVYYHLFPVCYVLVCGMVLNVLDDTKKKIHLLEKLKYKYKKA